MEEELGKRSNNYMANRSKSSLCRTGKKIRWRFKKVECKSTSKTEHKLDKKQRNQESPKFLHFEMLSVLSKLARISMMNAETIEIEGATSKS